MVVSELRGEKIDIIPYNDEPARFVAKALSPARVREVLVDDDAKQATVIVPDDQLSLAIGREGQNARLAARLTGWRIDIRSETEFADREADERLEEEEVERRAAPAILATAGAARTRRCRARATAACPPTRRSRPTDPEPLGDEESPAPTAPRTIADDVAGRGADAGGAAERRPRPRQRGRRMAPRRRRPTPEAAEPDGEDEPAEEPRRARRGRARAGTEPAAGARRPRAALHRLRALAPKARAAAAGRARRPRRRRPAGGAAGRGAYVCGPRVRRSGLGAAPLRAPSGGRSPSQKTS